VRQKDALYRLTDRLQQTNSAVDAEDAALDAIRDALACARASILLCDDERVMRFVAWRGLSDDYRRAVDGHSPWPRDAESPAPVCIEDVEAADLDSVLKRTILAEGIRAVAFIPLVVDGALVGKFMAYFDEPHVFRDDEIGLALTIARQLSSAIGRRRTDETLRATLAAAEDRKRELADALRERNERQLELEAELQDARLLHDISTALAAEDDTETLYQKLVDAASRVMHSEYASMQRLHAHGMHSGELELLAYRGFNAEAATFWRWVRAESESTCGMALRTRLRVIAPDVELCHFMAGSADLSTYRATGIRAVQTTPLLSRTGTLVGMISTHWRQAHQPPERNLRLLDIIARQAADLLERIGTAEALRDRAAELLAADRRKDEFLATLAHELRNPLAPISSGLALLHIGKLDAAARVLTMMERQLGHMVRLIDDLLDVSRITRGKIDLQKQRIGLGAVVGNAVETTRPLIDSAGHHLTVDLGTEPLDLDADPVRLAQVFSNLLNNAAKYTPNGGQIALRAEQRGAHVVVSVRDNGAGIRSDLLEQVFEPFVQGERNYNRSKGGLGIGLTLARSIVALHGGTIEGRSAGLGLGSEFLVRLPLPQVSGQSPPLESSPPQTRIAGQRILVVDDNVDAAESLGALLRCLGAEVVTVHDGPAALEALRKENPAAAVLDIGMPGMDGYEVARRVRAGPRGNDIKLIALTGWGNDDDRRRSREAGIDHHLVKPVDLHVLEDLLAAAQRGEASPANLH
jgi:signal transduction histidine kinase/ActR/RegA family two-component response regulator